MHISLTPELQKLINAKVQSGLYNNASEVIREALRFMEMNQDLVFQMKMDRLRTHLAAGEMEIEQGQGMLLKDKEAAAQFFAGFKE